jgi:integrase
MGHQRQLLRGLLCRDRALLGLAPPSSSTQAGPSRHPAPPRNPRRAGEPNGPFAANRARASLSALFSWAIGEGLLDSNPIVGTNKAIDETPRDRVLTGDELTLIWRHAGDLNYGAIIRLLVLTGQRREEVGGLRWSELRLPDGIWSISAERTKNGKPHDVPLSTLALEILNAQSKREDRDLLFGARGGAFQGWSRAKEALDRRMLVALQNAHAPATR